MTTLRDYQQRALDQLYTWFEAGNHGNPCVVMPTGAGKSHLVAALCKDALQNWPETRILMLTHVKELIEQNAEKMRQHWPDAPLGIYSAGIGRRDLGESITFAGIQSVREKAQTLGHHDLVIIDECHLVSHKNEGGYRKLLDDLKSINPALRVVGLTATPYRLGHGLITDKPALFDGLLEPVSIEELVFKNYLAPLRSKITKAKLETTGVHKRGGEYIESELQAAVDTDEKNTAVVREIINQAGERKAWLLFCTGVKHAHRVAGVLNNLGITADCVTGETPKKEREKMLADFKSGKIRAMTNANVLTTGFDYPDLDLIAMLRPTMSAGLYVQMAGRGMRVKSHTDHCMVLDFAGVVAAHGPITAVQPPKKGGEGNGEAPVKVCENCNELCAISAVICTHCGHPFPVSQPPKLKLRDDDIMGLTGRDMEVKSWNWRKHISRASGKEMLSCTYYGGLSDPPITEYFPVLHDGYAGQKAESLLFKIANFSHASLIDAAHKTGGDGLEYVAVQMSNSTPPANIKYKMEGKFHRVLQRNWA
jgi:DNA repair protein RadD